MKNGKCDPISEVLGLANLDLLFCLIEGTMLLLELFDKLHYFFSFQNLDMHNLLF